MNNETKEREPRLKNIHQVVAFMKSVIACGETLSTQDLADIDAVLAGYDHAAAEMRESLILCFKRNIAMHKNGPTLTSDQFSSEVRTEMQGFIRGLERGLEIVTLKDTNPADPDAGKVGDEEGV